MEKRIKNTLVTLGMCMAVWYSAVGQITYPIVDTGVTEFYSNNNVISAPHSGDDFFGQDATYTGNKPSYTDNGDGTITDNVTGLMWEKDMGEKVSFEASFVKAQNSNLGGHSDWRVPTIKELYSLILFTGQVKGAKSGKLFIDTDYFNQPLGNTNSGEREIDAQTWSTTAYVGRTMNGDKTIFGVNFVDGRIKGYPKFNKRKNRKNTMYFRMVRGNTEYGKNNFIDNGDGTVSDYATGLMWQKADDGIGRDWEASLAYSEHLELAGYSDWRLPNAKELQSIVDYSRSPQTTNSPAINPIFSTSEINDPEGNSGQYPFFWTSTTHLDGVNPTSGAVYVAFGEGQGKMRNQLMDVHGAGCQRSDPKSGSKNKYPTYFGPQGDVRYVYNYVRSVRTIEM
ncbi:Lcl C-terminal domain-containing protein [Formosa sp. 3Alg 14/1]|uniref:Lcl C-terminal domain-containing protein n=1 Tax=Formosa sp. 3Alg 14/1 TaxID=3382190 RepID=UPI0039BDC430